MATKIGYVPYTRDDGRQVRRLKIRCDCGLQLVCSQDINPCKCARDYNMSGQVMAPRNLWGEETGEHPADILLPLGSLPGDDW
jgi:hypothetical protein